MSQFILVLLMLSSFCVISDAQIMTALDTIVRAPVQLLYTLLGISSNPKSANRITAEVGEDSDLITIIRSPHSDLELSNIQKSLGGTSFWKLNDASGVQPQESAAKNSGKQSVEFVGDLMGGPIGEFATGLFSGLSGGLMKSISSGLGDLTDNLQKIQTGADNLTL